MTCNVFGVTLNLAEHRPLARMIEPVKCEQKFRTLTMSGGTHPALTGCTRNSSGESQDVKLSH